MDKIYWALVKDLKIEIERSFEIIASIGFVAIGALIIAQAAYIALEPALVMPAFWVVLLFVAMFTSTTTFIREADKKTLFGLKLIPTSPALIYIGKTLFTFIMLLIQGTVGIALLAVFSGQWYLISARFFAVFVLLSVYFSVVATFVSAVVMYSEGKVVLLPILLLVMCAPLIPPAISLSNPLVPFDLWGLALMLMGTIVTTLVVTLLSEYLLTA